MDFKRAKRYFQEHPEENKYDRKESGLESSYIIDRGTKRITRLANKDELEHVSGAGAFGRVKKSESKTEETVVKIQSRPIESPEDMEATRQDLDKEANINLDFGIAKGPLIQNINKKTGKVKYYQEMIRLEDTLDARIASLDTNQRIKTAIDYLLLVEDCHIGALTQSGDGYMHGDLSSANAMYDSKGKLRLIDFAFSMNLTTGVRHKDTYLKDDYKDAMRTLYHTPSEEEKSPATIFDTEQFNGFPIHLQKALAWQKYLRPDVKPEQNITFIAAVLISYQDNPALSEQDIENLRIDTYAQIMVVEQYKRKEALLQMPTEEAEKTLHKMVATLERYERFLNHKCNKKNQNPDNKREFENKKEALSRVMKALHDNLEHSPQTRLGILDQHLIAEEPILSPDNERFSGIFGYISSKLRSFLGNISTHTLTTKLDKKANMSSQLYRAALREQRERSGTENESLDSNSSHDDDSSHTANPNPLKNGIR